MQKFGVDENTVAIFVFGLVHGSIPNHWLPFVLLAKTEKFSIFLLSVIVAAGAIFHSLSTSLLGVFFSYLGSHMSEIEESERLVTSLLLASSGVLFLILKHREAHDHEEIVKKRKNNLIVITLLYLSLFFSPCVEVVPVFFSYGAKYGVFHSISLAFFYTLLTTLSMLFFSLLAFKGLLAFFPSFLQAYEKKIAGFFLILLGVFRFFVHAH